MVFAVVVADIAGLVTLGVWARLMGYRGLRGHQSARGAGW